MKKKEKESNRKNKKQSKISVILNSSKSRPVVLNNFMTQQSAFEIINSIQIVGKNYFFKKIVNLTLLNNFEDFYVRYHVISDIKSNIGLMVGILIYHKDKINKFLSLENELTDKIIDDDYVNAINTIDQIDELCGVSTWSMSIRGTLYKLSNQHDELQKFLSDVNVKAKNNEFIKSIAKCMLEIYDDDSLMYETSKEATKNEILRGIHGGLKDFLIYKIIPIFYRKNYAINYENVSNYERDSSLIDILKFIINYFVNCIGDNSIEYENFHKNIIDKLLKNIECPVLHGLKSHFTGDIEWKIENLDYKIIDNYTSGKYEWVINNFRSYQLVNFSTFEVVVKSFFKGKVKKFDGIKGIIELKLYSILNKNSDYKKSLSSIYALCHAFSGIPWFDELHYLVQREGSFVNDEEYNKLLTISCVLSKDNYPRRAHILTKDNKNNYLNICKKLVGNSISIDLYNSIFKNDIKEFKINVSRNIDNIRADKFLAKIYFNNAKYNEGIEILEKLLVYDDDILVNEIIYLLSKAYIDCGDFIKAIKLFCEKVIENNNTIYLFDASLICKVAKSLINESPSIYIPISLSLYSRFIDDKFDSALRYSFDRFLKHAHVQYPLDLINFYEIYEKKYIYYYLEHVCTPDKMKLSFLFDTKDDIEKYRIDICNFLISNDISKDTLISEAKELTKELVVKKATNHVDQSRVYADLSIFKDDNQIFKEIFERFKELKRNDYSKHADEIILNNIYKTLNQAEMIKSASMVHLIDTTYNEKNSTFFKLIKLMRNEFIYGDKGLNRYLSTRIRHGVLSGKLRTCASNENLVTSIDHESSKAKPNIYWLNKFQYIQKNILNEIEKSLNTFTIEFNSIISEINDKWLQVSSLDLDIKKLQSHDNINLALFDYTISMTETFSIEKSLTDNDYHSFVRVISSWLWKRTEYNLEKVKHKLCNEAQDRFVDCYNSLHDKIARLENNDINLSLLIDAINRSKDIFVPTINTVSQWFSVNKADSISRFDIQIAIEIAKRLLCVNVELSCDNEYEMNGIHLNSFVDIFYILFENACSKSGVYRDCNIKININVDFGNNLNITVCNDCIFNGDIERKNFDLCYYTDTSYGNEIIDMASHTEGGSGIFKIRKILYKDLEVDYDIKISYLANNLFSVNLIIKNFISLLYNENFIS